MVVFLKTDRDSEAMSGYCLRIFPEICAPIFVQTTAFGGLYASLWVVAIAQASSISDSIGRVRAPSMYPSTGISIGYAARLLPGSPLSWVEWLLHTSTH